MGIRYGTEATSKSLTVETSSTLILNRESKRIAVEISNPSTEDVYLQLGKNAVVGEGIYLQSGGGKFRLDLNSLYVGDIHGIADGASADITVIEIIDN